VAELTRHHRTVTAFLDGDRGGDLILEELAQVGDLDYVAFAPTESSVEDLNHHELFAALRNKVPYETVSELNEPRDAIAATDGSTTPAPPPSELSTASPTTTEPDDERAPDSSAALETPSAVDPERAATSRAQSGASAEEAETESERTRQDEAATDAESDTDRAPRRSTGTRPRSFGRGPTASAFSTPRPTRSTTLTRARPTRRSRPSETVPTTVVLDGILDQRLLDLAADRGVDRIIARSLGQFTKRPTDVRIHAIDDVAEQRPDAE